MLIKHYIGAKLVKYLYNIFINDFMSFYILIYFKMQVIHVIAKLNDSSEIIQICSWFAAQSFLLLLWSMLKTVVLPNIIIWLID